MKTTMKFLSTGLMVLALTMTSCTKDSAAGAIGPIGPRGEQGVAGQTGPAGQDGEAQGVPGPAGSNGTNGTDGTDGTDGQNGEDGNANVITSAWIPMSFQTNFFGTVFEISSNAFPSDVRDNYAIMVYVKKVFVSDAVYALPAEFGSFDIDYALLSDNTLRVFFNKESGSTANAPTGASVRYVLIEATNTSGKSAKESILNELKTAGVDSNDYYAVMDYFESEY